ncbi:hypothetical protein [Streptomyces sp. RLB3-17]|uniref:hypothetical protein n=1 Tax=Streptomyces sp. RLB3-17 TaxID=2594455 RepID=UPI0013E0C47D|nr:hypothetical protein [Streptomyces sp. RLB3-17]
MTHIFGYRSPLGAVQAGRYATDVRGGVLARPGHRILEEHPADTPPQPRRHPA